jgi:hypothetical protein
MALFMTLVADTGPSSADGRGLDAGQTVSDADASTDAASDTATDAGTVRSLPDDSGGASGQPVGAGATSAADSLMAELSEAGAAELSRLRQRCRDGYGADCDQLFELAPPDSDDERFGLSCGDRPTVLDCATLVPEAETEAEAGAD